MKRFIEGQDRSQVTLLPECLDDYIGEDNPVRVVDAFVDELELETLGFEGATAAATGRPSYHPSVLLKLYVYGYRECPNFCVRGALRLVHGGGRRLRRTTGAVVKSVPHITRRSW